MTFVAFEFQGTLSPIVRPIILRYDNELDIFNQPCGQPCEHELGED